MMGSANTEPTVLSTRATSAEAVPLAAETNRGEKLASVNVSPRTVILLAKISRQTCERVTSGVPSPSTSPSSVILSLKMERKISPSSNCPEVTEVTEATEARRGIALAVLCTVPGRGKTMRTGSWGGVSSVASIASRREIPSGPGLFCRASRLEMSPFSSAPRLSMTTTWPCESSRENHCAAVLYR